MLQKAKSGGWPGKAPIGYKNVRREVGSKGNYKIIVDEKTADLVRDTFRLYAAGNYSLAEVREMMIKKGLRVQSYKNIPPKPPTKTTITRGSNIKETTSRSSRDRSLIRYKKP